MARSNRRSRRAARARSGELGRSNPDFWLPRPEDDFEAIEDSRPYFGQAGRSLVDPVHQVSSFLSWQDGSAGGMGRSPISARYGKARFSRKRKAQPLLAKPIFRVVAKWPRSISVRSPVKVRFCLFRRARREILFAFRIAGRRGIGRGGVKRTAESRYSC